MENMKRNRWPVTSVLTPLLSMAVLSDSIHNLDRSNNDNDGRFPREVGSKNNAITYGGGDLPGPGPPPK
ncbi:MAG: hypothetical protein HXS48_14945 [Theionarchaea archaeon]|nr:hypothetical protein [Theionarchaea archaeon]